MYKQKINYLVIGIFVIAMLTAGVVSVALLTGRTGPVDRYFIVLDNVADVKFGTQVRYEGYPVGQVESITPVVEGAGMKFRVDVTIHQGWRIPADSVARIGSSSFLAAKTIDIESGDSPAAVALGERIASALSMDIFSTITATADEISDLSRKSIGPLLATLQSLAATVQADAPQITRELIAFTEGLNATLAPVQEVLSDTNVLAIGNTIQNVEEAAITLNALGRELTGTMVKVDNLASNLDRLAEDNKGTVDQSLKDIRYTLSAVAATVDSLVHNLDGTARNMNEFSRLIRQNPGLLLDGTPRKAVSPVRATTGKQDGQG